MALELGNLNRSVFWAGGNDVLFEPTIGKAYKIRRVGRRSFRQC